MARRGPFDEKQHRVVAMKAMAAQLATCAAARRRFTREAQAAAHAHGLLHRDIKPANILLETASSE